MDELLDRFRRIFVTYCYHCRCYESGICWRDMRPVKTNDVCERWSE